MNTKTQPVSNVKWVARDTLRANDYNPNHVAPAELELLRLSLLADGWTQPLVATPDGEIIDGFHRWLVAEDPELAGMTGGKVPVIYLTGRTPAERIASTIRHNRARGVHAVEEMGAIVRRLMATEGVTWDAVRRELGMEEEELDRLADVAGMTVRGAGEGFGEGWNAG